MGKEARQILVLRMSSIGFSLVEGRNEGTWPLTPSSLALDLPGWTQRRRTKTKMTHRLAKEYKKASSWTQPRHCWWPRQPSLAGVESWLCLFLCCYYMCSWKNSVGTSPQRVFSRAPQKVFLFTNRCWHLARRPHSHHSPMPANASETR